MQAIGETVFDVIYLTLVITVGIIMIIKSSASKVGNRDLTFEKSLVQYRLFGIMAVVLGAGDAFHLVPRAYLGYLKAQDNVEFLAPAIKKLVMAEIEVIENKLSRQLFKIAVELGKIANIIAAENEIDDETLRELHITCVEEVRRLNGFISYEKAARFQRGDD